MKNQDQRESQVLQKSSTVTSDTTMKVGLQIWWSFPDTQAKMATNATQMYQMSENRAGMSNVPCTVQKNV